MLKIKQFISHIIRGCGTLPNCGEHPGTMFLFGFIIMGAIAGLKGGFIGALITAGAMSIFVGPIYLCGAYSRSKWEERIELTQKENTHEAERTQN